jgi:hypothetical protein
MERTSRQEYTQYKMGKGISEENIGLPYLYFLNILVRYRIEQRVVFQIKHLISAV